jgi:hypothetical protein
MSASKYSEEKKHIKRKECRKKMEIETKNIK